MVSMSKNSRNASTRQTSPGEVKNSSYASECFLTVAGTLQRMILSALKIDLTGK